jgi:hypothetical protein
VGLSGINCANFDHGRVKRWRRLVRQHRLLRRCHRWNYEADNCQIYSRSHCCRPAQGCLDTPSFYNGTDRANILNPNGSWKEPQTKSTGETVGVDKDRLEYLVDSQMQRIAGLQAQLERVRDWSSGNNGEANIALSSLVRIVSDSTASMRQRIKAAGAVLGYKVQDEGVVEFTKRFLESVCESADVSNVDYKIEAGELLRKHEAPRIASETVRPSYTEGDTAANRTEAWRVYERWQLKKQIVIETHDLPPPGWDDHLQRDTYVGPPEGNAMPPVRVVTDPVSGFRLLDNLLPKRPYRIGNGSNDDTSAS